MGRFHWTMASEGGGLYVICMNDNTSENLKNEVFNRMMGGSVVSTGPRKVEACSSSGGKRCSAAVRPPGSSPTSEHVSEDEEWPSIHYEKRKGNSRVSRFDVLVDSETRSEVERMLSRYEFDEDVTRMEGNKRCNALYRYLCFCSGDLEKAQSPKSMKVYVRKLKELANPGARVAIKSNFEPLSAKTFANEMSALKGAIVTVMGSEEEGGEEGWRHWTSTLIVIKGGTRPRSRAASKAQSVARIAKFERLPPLKDAIAKVDAIVTVDFIKRNLKLNTAKGWNLVVGGVISHLYARCNFARPQMLKEIRRKDLVKLIDGDVIHTGAFKNHASFSGGQTAKMMEGEHMTHDVLDCFVKHFPMNYLAPVFHPYGKHGAAMTQPCQHMTALTDFRATDWRKMIEVHFEEKNEKGELSNAARERCAHSQNHSVKVARTIYANRSNGNDYNPARSYVKARHDALISANVLHINTSSPNPNPRRVIVDSESDDGQGCGAESESESEESLFTN